MVNRTALATVCVSQKTTIATFLFCNVCFPNNNVLRWHLRLPKALFAILIQVFIIVSNEKMVFFINFFLKKDCESCRAFRNVARKCYWCATPSQLSSGLCVEANEICPVPVNNFKCFFLKKNIYKKITFNSIVFTTSFV